MLPQVEQLTTDLNGERAHTQKLENERSQVERQNKELKSKVSDLENQLKSRSKAMIATLEAKVANLEEQLETESRYKQPSWFIVFTVYIY